jgi:hypothetical protein
VYFTGTDIWYEKVVPAPPALNAPFPLDDVIKRWPEWKVDFDEATRTHTAIMRWRVLPRVSIRPVRSGLYLRPVRSTTPFTTVSRALTSAACFP